MDSHGLTGLSFQPRWPRRVLFLLEHIFVVVWEEEHHSRSDVRHVLQLPGWADIGRAMCHCRRFVYSALGCTGCISSLLCLFSNSSCCTCGLFSDSTGVALRQFCIQFWFRHNLIVLKSLRAFLLERGLLLVAPTSKTCCNSLVLSIVGSEMTWCAECLQVSTVFWTSTYIYFRIFYLQIPWFNMSHSILQRKIISYLCRYFWVLSSVGSWSITGRWFDFLNFILLVLYPRKRFPVYWKRLLLEM